MGRCRVCIKILRKIKKQSQKRDGRNGQTKIVKKKINTAVQIDDRQYDRFIDKKTWSKPIPKNKPQFKKDLIKLDVTEKKRFKKNLLRLQETGSFKMKLFKK